MLSLILPTTTQYSTSTQTGFDFYYCFFKSNEKCFFVT
eukprot:UN07165